ncbi:hypothetical protein [Acidicapsa ligni]|uniref:hypothetical protein n=1 Tax=Acidicapsa ligni TaxID=542300 RepID=UPI0021E045BA|nr:hypothetical protein [Acidicapsa ligni]
MEATCQRCHEILRGADRYCPACGLPQLVYIAEEPPPLPLGDVADAAGENAQALSGSATGIAWRPALKAAGILAIPAGLLCSALTPIGSSLALIWMMGAAVWAVRLYLKGARISWLSMGNGARIGLVTGLFASWLTLSVNGAKVWADRFVMHQGSQMDSEWLGVVEKSLSLDQQMATQMGMTAAQAEQIVQVSRAWMTSAEGRAGLALATFLIGSVFLILFSTIGGVVGARFMGQSSRRSA